METDRPKCDCCNQPMIKKGFYRHGGQVWICPIQKANQNRNRTKRDAKYNASLKGHERNWRIEDKQRQERIVKNTEKLERLYEEG